MNATSVVTWSCSSSGVQDVPQPSWIAFTGQTSSEMLGDGWIKAIHPDDLDTAFRKWSEAVASGELFTNEHRIKRRDGEWRWMSVTAVPIFDSGESVIEWSGMCLDITDRKLAEEKLLDTDRRKTEFLATLAHELRNPLTPIRASADLIKLAGTNPSLVNEAGQLLERQVEQMTRLVNDLMEISRVSSGKIVLQKSAFPLNLALQIAVDASQALIAS